MADKHKTSETQLVGKIDDLVKHQKKRNKLAKRQNQIAEAQLAQSQYTFEQTERLYLLEKSKLQPKFSLQVTEFLLCEPDYMNDPEQAGEAKFLTDHDIAVDERVVRFQINVIEKGQHLRPRLVVTRTGVNKEDDLAMALTGKLYFLPFQ